MTRIVRFQQLKAWEVSHQLVLGVYRLVQELLTYEQYGLSSQMRRAAVSVPANIAEASPEELKYCFIPVRDLGYANDYESMMAQANQAGRLLSGFITSTERRT